MVLQCNDNSPQTSESWNCYLTVFCQYSNDNPFSKSAREGFWSGYISVKHLICISHTGTAMLLTTRDLDLHPFTYCGPTLSTG